MRFVGLGNSFYCVTRKEVRVREEKGFVREGDKQTGIKPKRSFTACQRHFRSFVLFGNYNKGFF